MQQQPYEFTKLIQCWQSMPREPGQAPKKTTFSPGKVSNLMPFLFLIEREVEGGLIVRLLGSELEAQMGCSGGNRRVFDAMMRRDWAFYDHFLRGCADHICAGRLLRSVKLKDGLVRDVESLHVPLANNEGDAIYMLGVMSNRASQGGGSAGRPTSPKSAILNYQYVDLGCGLPCTNTDVAPAKKAIKSNKRFKMGKAVLPQLVNSGEYVPVSIN